VSTRLFVGSAESAYAAARAGIGTMALSYQLTTAPERGAVTTVLDEFRPAPLPINLVYAADRFLPIKVRAYLDFAAPRLKRILRSSTRQCIAARVLPAMAAQEQTCHIFDHKCVFCAAKLSRPFRR
jgi:hypothetical protein